MIKLISQIVIHNEKSNESFEMIQMNLINEHPLGSTK